MNILEVIQTINQMVAIALETGRAKDKARLLQFLEEGALDTPTFQTIVTEHNLLPKWQKFELQFLDES